MYGLNLKLFTMNSKLRDVAPPFIEIRFHCSAYFERNWFGTVEFVILLQYGGFQPE